MYISVDVNVYVVLILLMFMNIQILYCDEYKFVIDFIVKFYAKFFLISRCRVSCWVFYGRNLLNKWNELWLWIILICEHQFP